VIPAPDLADLERGRARGVIEEALTVWRELAWARSDAHTPNLTTSLGNRSMRKGEQRSG